MPPARTFPTEAIVLKRLDYAEADRIITVLTPHHGKLRLLAKGVRRVTSRQAGHLEPFTHAHVMVARGRSLDLVTQATTLSSFWEVRESLTRSSYAFHLAEMVDAFVQDGDEHRPVFDLLRDALGALSGEAPLDLVARHFEMHLLAEVGFRPQLDACVACDAVLVPATNGYSVPRGGAFCPACAPHEPSAVAIDVSTLKMLRLLQRTASARSLGVRAPRAVLEDVEIVLRRQVEYSLDRRLRAADFVRVVAAVPRG